MLVSRFGILHDLVAGIRSLTKLEEQQERLRAEFGHRKKIASSVQQMAVGVKQPHTKADPLVVEKAETPELAVRVWRQRPMQVVSAALDSLAAA